MPKFVASRSTVDQAIQRAQDFLLSTQAPDGHWRGELEADSTITSEYLLLCHLIDRVDREREKKAGRYLRAGPPPRRRLPPLRGRPRRPLGHHQGLLRAKAGGRLSRGSRPGPGAPPDPPGPRARRA